MLGQGQQPVQLLPLLLLLALAVPLSVQGHAMIRQEASFGEVCYDQIGCFKNEGHFFDWFKRPVFLLPQNPNTIGTKFVLYTRSNVNSGHLVDYNRLDTLTKSKFNSRKQTRFLIHGYMSDPQTNWVLKMKDALLQQQDENVFVVDWSAANGPIYSQATANTRVVGAVTALMIQWLERQAGASRAKMHIIGHSLGAHTAGYAGERLNGLGRITGMDPAGPYFENTHPVVRLDPTDAKFVDAIHTDTVDILRGGFGILQPVGHLDIYPNGGKEQPGCTKNPIVSITENDKTFSITCNHVRVAALITSTIYNPSGKYEAVECSSYEDYKSGKCRCGSKICVRMGITADQWKQDGRQNVKMYLDTTSKSPFDIGKFSDHEASQSDTADQSVDLDSNQQDSKKVYHYLGSSVNQKSTVVVNEAHPLFKEL